MVLLKLLDAEKRCDTLNIPATNAISFYKNASECPNIDKIKQGLINRFTDILKYNPWLSSRLFRTRVGGVKDIYLSYSENISNPEEYISFITYDDLFKPQNACKRIDLLTPHILKDGSKCLDKDERLCQLKIFGNKALNELAIMFSLSHNLGDGCTFYSIWKMLDKNQTLSPMCVERVLNIDEIMENETNVPPLSSWTGLGAMLMLWRLFCRGMNRKIRRKSPLKTYMYKVNVERVAQIKKELNSETSFVSTHDIVCTHLYKRCENGLIFAMNMRGRLTGVHQDLAGNYETVCPINLSANETPPSFREKWAQVLKKQRPADQVKCPNLFTSWTSFYHQVEVKGFDHTFHMPVYDMEEGSRVLGISIVNELEGIMFKLNNDNIGLFLKGSSDIITEDFFDECELIDGKVLL